MTDEDEGLVDKATAEAELFTSEHNKKSNFEKMIED